MKKKGYSLIQVIVIILVTSIISAITVGVIFTKSSSSTVNYKELVVDENVKEFLDVYTEIVNEYYEDVDKKEVIQNAINGMMEYLDESYTTYLEGEEATSLIEQLSGQYEGIGVTIKEHAVVNTLAGSPAEKAGILSGDIINDVNGILVVDKTTEEIVDLIKQNKQNVVLGIIRNNEYHTYTMSVTTLKVPSVSYNMVENTNIGYIQISVFSDGTAEEVQSSLDKLKKQGMQRIIVDLRNNTGGYLEEAYSTASLFLEKGKLIYSLKNKDETEKYYDKTNDVEKMPMVLLVNKATASAAEILAASLKDSYNADIVGLTTYGKGKVQHTYSLESGDIVKYTSSKWLRPNGTCIDGVGIKPDFEIENQVIYDESDPENVIITEIIDVQLNKAIELLSV